MPKTLPLILLTICISLLLPHLYSRLKLLHTLSFNHPSILKPRGAVIEAGNYEVKFRETLRNCEDLVLDTETGVAVLSCDEGRDGWYTVMGHFTNPTLNTGRLYIYTYSSPRPHLEPLALHSLPQNYSFHPLGLALHNPSQTLALANHGLSTSTLDIFSYTRHGNTLTLLKQISSPLLHTPNSITFLNSKEVLVTNDHYFSARTSVLLSKLETFVAAPALAGVVHVDLETEVVTPIARLAFANGIARLNDSVIAVASSSTAKIAFYDIDTSTSSPPKLWFRTAIDVPFIPDNLHVDQERKTLLIAGHAHISSFTGFCEERSRCGGDTWSEGCRGQSPSFAVEWTEEGGLRELVVGDFVMTASSVVRDSGRGVGLVTGLYGKGILVWEE